MLSATFFSEMFVALAICFGAFSYLIISCYKIAKEAKEPKPWLNKTLKTLITIGVIWGVSLTLIILLAMMATSSLVMTGV